MYSLNITGGACYHRDLQESGVLIVTKESSLHEMVLSSKYIGHIDCLSAVAV